MSGGMIKGGGRAIMSRESQRALIDLLIALEGVETATATSGGGGEEETRRRLGRRRRRRCRRTTRNMRGGSSPNY